MVEEFTVTRKLPGCVGEEEGELEAGVMAAWISSNQAGVACHGYGTLAGVAGDRRGGREAESVAFTGDGGFASTLVAGVG